MKIEIKETLDYRTKIDKVETFEEGEKYDVADSVGKSIVSSGKAVDVTVSEADAKAEADAKEQSNVKPDETKIVKPEVKKEEAPKADKKKADKQK